MKSPRGSWGWGGRSWRCLFTGWSVLPAVSSKSIDTFTLYSQACGIPGDAHSIKFFPGSSVGKESACNAGDPGWIPGLGRSPGEGIGYPLQYSWASLVAQMVKNLPAMLETWARSLGWENPLEEGMATHSSILAWRTPWTEEPCGLQSTGSQRVGHD